MDGGAYKRKTNRKYTSGWKKGVPKKPGYKLVMIDGTPKYVKTKAKFYTGYNLFVEDWNKRNDVEGKNKIVMASKDWAKLTKAQKDEWARKAKAKGKQTTPGPMIRNVAEVHLRRISKERLQRSKNKSRSKSRRGKSKSRSSRSRSRSSRSRGRSESRSRGRKSSKTRSRGRKSSKSRSRGRKSSKSRSRKRSSSRGRGHFPGVAYDSDEDEDDDHTMFGGAGEGVEEYGFFY